MVGSGFAKVDYLRRICVGLGEVVEGRRNLLILILCKDNWCSYIICKLLNYLSPCILDVLVIYYAFTLYANFIDKMYSFLFLYLNNQGFIMGIYGLKETI